MGVSEPPAILLYDELCPFCEAVAGRLAERGLPIAGIGSASGAEALRGVPEEARRTGMHVVLLDGRVLSGAAALPALADRLPAGRLVAFLCSLSPRLCAAGYRLVAANRQPLGRLLGLPACRACAR